MIPAKLVPSLRPHPVPEGEEIDKQEVFERRIMPLLKAAAEAADEEGIPLIVLANPHRTNSEDRTGTNERHTLLLRTFEGASPLMHTMGQAVFILSAAIGGVIEADGSVSQEQFRALTKTAVADWDKTARDLDIAND